jgi:probable selenium-dependent hydroxylase accessory protein YqeC
MWHFRRINLVEHIQPCKYISLVGAGGKTSFSEFLAAGIVRSGKTVAITTTTKIYAREPYRLIPDNWSSIDLNVPFMRYGRTLENGKLTALDFTQVRNLGNIFDVVLIEADGAKEKPLKVPASYEPVIPGFSEKILVVSGLDALLKPVDETVFRWELLDGASGIEPHALITADLFARFFSESILLKGVDKTKCSVILNKYDILPKKEIVLRIAKNIVKKCPGLPVILSSVHCRAFYLISG